MKKRGKKIPGVRWIFIFIHVCIMALEVVGWLAGIRTYVLACWLQTDKI